MSWAQQREQIRRAAQAGVRPRTSGLGSQILPLRGPGGQSAQLTRPNGALTRAGQFFYQLAGRQPPSRQFDDSQPLIREGASDFILLRSGLKKLVRTLAPDGNYHLTKLGKAFFKEKYTERPGLRAAGLPARDLAERGAAEAERRAVGGAGGPQCQASGAAEAGQCVGGRRDHGALRGGLLPRRRAGVDAELADHAARRQPHACGNEPAAAARRPARGLLPALQGRRDPGLSLRAAGRQALRGPGWQGALRLRHHLRPRLAGAGRHAQGDPQVLRLAGRTDALRELPGSAPGLLPAGREGGARHGLHGLGGSRVLLQECAQRLPVRRCGAPAPPL